MNKRQPRHKTSGGSGLAEFHMVEVSRIVEPPLAARIQMTDAGMADLVESMRALGQIEPITLERHAQNYEVITGHRRFLAAKILEWHELKALVWPEGQADKLAMMLHENVVREALNPAEEAIFMKQAQEQLGLDEDGLTRLFKRNGDYIAKRLALLRGDRDIFLALQQGQIRLGVAHELNRITDMPMRHYYLDCAKRTDPPADVVHGWVAEWRLRHDAQMAAVASGLAVAAGQAWEAGQPGGTPGANGAPIEGDTPPIEQSFGCELCGGWRDPYNVVTIRIHKWEWERIMEQVHKATGKE